MGQCTSRDTKNKLLRSESWYNQPSTSIENKVPEEVDASSTKSKPSSSPVHQKVTSSPIAAAAAPPKLSKGIRKLIPIAPNSSSGATVSPKKSYHNLDLVKRNPNLRFQNPNPHRQVTFLIDETNIRIHESNSNPQNLNSKSHESVLTHCAAPIILSPQEELSKIREQKARLRQQFFNDTQIILQETMPVTKETVSSAAHKNAPSSTGIPKLYSVRSKSPQPQPNLPIPCPTFNLDTNTTSPRNSNSKFTTTSTGNGSQEQRRAYNVPSIITTGTATSRIPQVNQNSVSSPSNSNLNGQGHGQRPVTNLQRRPRVTTTLKKPEPTVPFYMQGIRHPNTNSGTGLVQQRTTYWQSRIGVPSKPNPNNSFIRTGVGGIKEDIKVKEKDKAVSISINRSRSERTRPSPSLAYQGNRSSELRRRKNSASPTPPPHADHEFLDDEISDQPGLLIGAHQHHHQVHSESFKETSSLLACSSSASVSLSSSASSLDKDKSLSPSPRGSSSSVTSSVPSCRDVVDSADEKTITVPETQVKPIPKYSYTSQKSPIQTQLEKSLEVGSILPDLSSIHTELVILKEAIELQVQVIEEKDTRIQNLEEENQELKSVIQRVCSRLVTLEGLGTTNNGYIHEKTFKET